MVTADNESYAKICGLLYKQPIIQEDDIKGNSILNFKKTAATNTTGGVQCKLDDVVPKYNVPVVCPSPITIISVSLAN